MSEKNVCRRIWNRLFHSLARTLPGATSLRLFLHRLRGVKIGSDVFIGEDVYLENEYPEAIEIGDGVQISLRAVLIAHTRGPGKIVIGKNAYIGPSVMLISSSGRTLKIGEGAVVGAGVVVSNDIADHMFVPSPQAKAVARATIPLATAEKIEDFIRGLVPVGRAGSDQQSEALSKR